MDRGRDSRAEESRSAQASSDDDVAELHESAAGENDGGDARRSSHRQARRDDSCRDHERSDRIHVDIEVGRTTGDDGRTHERRGTGNRDGGKSTRCQRYDDVDARQHGESEVLLTM